MRYCHKLQHGFTLVEISVVMIVVGLIIGGVFSGIQMIETSKARTTIQQIRAIESAALKFRDTYGSLPGDMPRGIVKPSQLIPGCNSFCDPSTTIASDGILGAWSSPATVISSQHDQFLFWMQLSGAGMLDNIIVTMDGNTAFGFGQPLSLIDTGMRIAFDSGSNCIAPRKHSLFLTNIPTAAMMGMTVDDLVVPGARANYMDTKFDDSVPSSGRFKSWRSAVTVGSPGSFPVEGSYDINSNYGSFYIYNF